MSYSHQSAERIQLHMLDPLQTIVQLPMPYKNLVYTFLVTFSLNALNLEAEHHYFILKFMNFSG